MVTPVLLILMLSGFQLISYINATRKVEALAAAISETISQVSPAQNSSTATITDLDLQLSTDSALVIFPYLMTDAKRQNIKWWQDISIQYSSVQFTQVLTSCAGQADQSACYTATVAWTTKDASGFNYRACVVPQVPVDDTAVPSRLSLPRSVYGPGTLIVIDVVFKFQPTFGAKYLPAVTIARSVYVQPRYAASIKLSLDTNNTGIASTCPSL